MRSRLDRLGIQLSAMIRVAVESSRNPFHQNGLRRTCPTQVPVTRRIRKQYSLSAAPGLRAFGAGVVDTRCCATPALCNSSESGPEGAKFAKADVVLALASVQQRGAPRVCRLTADTITSGWQQLGGLEHVCYSQGTDCLQP